MKIRNRGELTDWLNKYAVETKEVKRRPGVETFHTVIFDKKLDRHYRIEWGNIEDENGNSQLWYKPEAVEVWLNKSNWKKGWFTKGEVRIIDDVESKKLYSIDVDSYLLFNVEMDLINVNAQNNYDYDNLSVVGGQTGKGKTFYSIRRSIEELIRGNSVLFFSIDESVEQILNKFRVVLKNTRILSQITDKEFKNDKEKDSFVIDFIKKANLKIINKDMLYTKYIIDTIKENSNSENGLDYVVVDGLHLVTHEKENNVKYYDAIQSALEDVGNKVGCNILLTTHINNDF